LVTSDARFRRMIFEFAKLPTRDENYIRDLDKETLAEEFKIKIKDYIDNHELWSFIRTHEGQLSQISNWDTYRRAIFESEETLQSNNKE
jgi:hypothetical protein